MVSVLKLSITGGYIIAFVFVLRDKTAYIPGDEKRIEYYVLEWRHRKLKMTHYGPGGALDHVILAA
jgi:hypothetical protein